jgi:hypothetical protein
MSVDKKGELDTAATPYKKTFHAIDTAMFDISIAKVV